MKQTSILFSVAILLLAADISFGQQSYEQLRSQILERQQNTRQQIQNLESQIENYNRRLGEATEEFDEVFQRFEELNRLISLQEERLRQLNREQRQINEEITLIENQSNRLEQELSELIEQYKSTLTYLYKHGRTTELALLLTSESINQLLVRSYYLRQFDTYRGQQIEEIEKTRDELAKAREDLEQTRARNNNVLAEIRTETENLETQKEQQQETVNALRADINNLEREKEEREQQIENFRSTMDNLMREEERLRRAEASGEEVVVREELVSEEELSVFESSFRDKRGQLSWPVDNGTITERFGVRVHPVFNTRTNNPGVDIAASPESSVKVVSDGYVWGIQPLQGYGEVIFVHHGNYKTAYGNLSDIFVRRNQVLREGDVIGLSGNESSIRGEVLFFSIRDGNQFVDPENWLQRAQP